jgi:hypothetical protein
MSESDHLTVGELFLKSAHGAPMCPADRLQLRPGTGAVGSVSKIPSGPRQLCLAVSGNIEACGLDAADARVNMVLRTDADDVLDSGNLVEFDEAAVRVAFACEVCAHGAQLAATPMRRFRDLQRMIGIVIRGGVVRQNAAARVVRGAFEPVPDTFVERCAWSAARIPAGQAVNSTDFLTAIGAGPSYHRVLPRWMRAAGDKGLPIHRVLSTSLAAPSWAPDALDLLEAEGSRAEGGPLRMYPLVEELWFGGRAKAAEDRRLLMSGVND